MNKRKKKQRDRLKKELEKEFSVCQDCGEKLDMKDEYHRRYGTCNSTCYMHMIGMSWSDFM